MSIAVSFCLVVVGLINFVPVVGMLSADKLASAYSITLAGNDLEILMRHRALLFGIFGAFIIYSAFNPIYQNAAMTMAAVSMVGFAVLVLSTGGYNAAVGKVLYFDLAGIVFLAAAIGFKYLGD